VTNWYLNYLDCRLKRIAYALMKVVRGSDQFPSAQDHIINMFDLGPGEIVKNDSITKYNCYRVVTGSIKAH